MPPASGLKVSCVMRSRVVQTVLILAGSSLALGCGSGDGGAGGGKDDEAQITAVVTKGLTTSDPEVKCVETVTPDFVKQVYGSLEQCRKAETPGKDADPDPTGAAVKDIVVEGTTATASVTVVGGNSDKAVGTIGFAKDGEDWKVDDLGVSFLRSQLSQGFANRTYTAEDGPLVEPTFRTCVLAGFSAMDDATFKAVAQKGIAKTAPDARFVEIFSTCQASTPGNDGGNLPKASKVRESFETGLGKDARKGGGTDAQITCVFKKLRESLPDSEILAEIKQGSFEDPQGAVKTKVNAAIKGCPATSGASTGLPKAPTRIRESFEGGLIKTASRSSTTSKTKLNCILLALRTSLTDADIAKAVAKGKASLAAADNPIATAIREADAGC